MRLLLAMLLTTAVVTAWLLAIWWWLPEAIWAVAPAWGVQAFAPISKDLFKVNQ